MKEEKGFTLIEMIAVIVIIGVIMILLMPTIINMGKGTKKATYQNKVSIIKTGAVNYIENNKNFIKGGEDYCVTIEYLIKKGYLTSDGNDGAYILNPEDNEKITSKVLVTYKQSTNGVYKGEAELTEGECTIIGGNEDDDSSSSGYEYLENPGITFTPNGNSIASKSHSAKIVIKEIKNLKYKWSQEKEGDASSGTAFTSGNDIIKNDGTGSYYLCVYGEDIAGNEYNECSNAFVFDNTPPTCSLTKGAKATTLTITASGSDVEGSGVASLTINGTVYTTASKAYTTQTVGAHTLIVKDVAGNSTTCTTTVSKTTVQGTCAAYASCSAAGCKTANSCVCSYGTGWEYHRYFCNTYNNSNQGDGYSTSCKAKQAGCKDSYGENGMGWGCTTYKQVSVANYCSDASKCGCAAYNSSSACGCATYNYTYYYE